MSRNSICNEVQICTLHNNLEKGRIGMLRNLSGLIVRTIAILIRLPEHGAKATLRRFGNYRCTKDGCWGVVPAFISWDSLTKPVTDENVALSAMGYGLCQKHLKEWQEEQLSLREEKYDSDITQGMDGTVFNLGRRIIVSANGPYLSIYALQATPLDEKVVVLMEWPDGDGNAPTIYVWGDIAPSWERGRFPVQRMVHKVDVRKVLKEERREISTGHES